MGSLILCHKKRAKRPFEISRVHMRIYTIEGAKQRETAGGTQG